MATLKKNITSLVVVQLLTYIIPLLQIPYLTRVLGIQSYSLFAYALILTQMANIVTDFGLNLYLPQKIASGKNGRVQLGRYYAAAMLIKLALLIPVCLAFFALVITNDKYNDNLIFFSLFFIGVVGNAFSLLWLYQGLEKIYIYSRIFISIKAVSLVAIVLLVEKQQDINLLGFINGIQPLILFAILAAIASKKYNVKIRKTTFRKVKIIFKDSLDYFTSRAFVSIYTAGCGLFLGYFGTAHQLSYYNAAEQLYRSAQQVFNPFSQALYPYMARTKDYRVFFKITLLCIAICLTGIAFGYFCGEILISLLYGADFAAAYSVLLIFLVALLFNTLAVLLGYPALVPLNLSRVANRSVIYAGSLQIIMLGVLYYMFKPITAEQVAFTVVICEFIVMTLRGLALNKGLKNEVR